MAIPPHDHRGLLPPGRYPADLHELKAAYATTRQRSQMFAQVIGLSMHVIRYLDRLPYIWIGGSFLDLSKDPRDLDLTLLLTAKQLDAALKRGGAAGTLTKQLADGTLGPQFPLLDVHLLAVEPPFVGAMAEASRTQRIYMAHRGYWDELWSSARATGNGNIPGDHGYLEVRIDGFS